MKDLFHIEIILNPRSVKYDQLPLKRFYRYALETEPLFNGNGARKRPGALFRDIPAEPLLTLGMDVIQPWVVGPVVSPYDLDNIRLRDLTDPTAKQTGIQAEFQLQHILVEGHCRDLKSGYPPRGLQFELATTSNATHYDTIVMANLGYYQLKSSPGVWQLRIREGRSKELYSLHDILSGSMEIQSADGEAVDVILAEFTGVLLITRVFSFRPAVLIFLVGEKEGWKGEGATAR